MRLYQTGFGIELKATDSLQQHGAGNKLAGVEH